METLSPDLFKLHSLADTLLSKPTNPKLTVACFSILQACSFFFPEYSPSIWTQIWKSTIAACREKSLQVYVAVEGFHVLSVLCSSTIEILNTCFGDLQDLISNTELSNELKETSMGLLRRARRTKQTVLKYGMYCIAKSTIAIWRYDEIRKAFIEFIKAVAQTEAKKEILSSSSSFENSTTKMVLNAVTVAMPSLSVATLNSPTEIKLYCRMIVELCTSIANVVDNKDIRGITYQIMVSGLGSESPPVVVLPCIVNLSIIEGDERVKEVNRLLTGLLMNYKLVNV